jgi:hypothetical protein
MSDTNSWTVRMYKAELEGMEEGLMKIKSHGLCTLSAEKVIAEKKKQILKASK